MNEGAVSKAVAIEVAVFVGVLDKVGLGVAVGLLGVLEEVEVKVTVLMAVKVFVMVEVAVGVIVDVLIGVLVKVMVGLKVKVSMIEGLGGVVGGILEQPRPCRQKQPSKRLYKAVNKTDFDIGLRFISRAFTTLSHLVQSLDG